MTSGSMELAAHYDGLELQLSGPIPSHMTAQGGDGLNISVLTSLYVDELRRRLAHLPQSGNSLSKCELRAALAAFASLAAIVLLLFECGKFTASVLKPGNLKRRLSESEGSSGSELPRMCEEGALESDSAPPVSRAYELAEEGPVEPIARTPAMEVDETETPVFAELVSPSYLHSGAHARVPAPPTRSEQRIQIAQFGLLPVQESHPTKSFAHQQAHTSAYRLGGFASGTPVPRSSDELAAACGLILLQAQAPQDTTAQHVTTCGTRIPKQQQVIVADVHSFAGVSGAHVAAVSPSGLPAFQPLIVLQLPVCARADGQQRNDQRSPLTGPSFEGPLGAAEGQDEQRAHLFARLPGVLNPGSYSHLVDPEYVVSLWIRADLRQVNLSYKYERLAKLLIRESLSPKEMTLVAKRAKDLMIGIVIHRFPDLNSRPPAHAALTLSIGFLSLNALVAALQILGVARKGTWWDRLTARVPNSYELATVTYSCDYLPTFEEKKREFTRDLVVKLRNAIGALKEGNRPDTLLLVELYEMLFCREFSPELIKGSRWNIWRVCKGAADGAN